MRTQKESKKQLIKQILKIILLIEVVFFGWTLHELIEYKSTITTYNELVYVPNPKTIEEKIAQYDWDFDTAYAVMMAESGANPNAKNLKDSHRGCRGSYGLYQIACIHDDPEKLLDEDYNIERAYELYSESGWVIWGAYTDKRFLAYKN